MRTGKKISFGAIMLLIAMVVTMTERPQAQTDLSTIRGTATDPTGADVPNADITVTNIETSIVARSTKTDQNGNYEVPYLKLGTYRITAKAAGFATYNADNVILQSNQTARVDISFTVGSTTETINVAALAPVIQQEGASVSSEFTVEKYLQSPQTVAYQIWSIFTTLPSHSSSPTGLGDHTESGLGFQNAESSVDGITLGPGLVRSVGFTMEDLGEFHMGATNNTAEFGRPVQWNAVTRSGTNMFHGRFYTYFRNEALNAKPSFSPKKVEDRDILSGLSIGGPIIHDRTFFFAAWNSEWVPTHFPSVISVAPLQMRNGDFSQLLSLSTPVVITDPQTGQPFPGNVIPTNRLNPVSLQIQDQYLTKPNLGSPNELGQNYFWDFPHNVDWSSVHFLDTRIDHKISEKNSLALKAAYMYIPYILPWNAPNMDWTRTRYHWVVSASDTHVFSPSFLNEFRGGWTREKFADSSTHNGLNVLQTLGIQGISHPPNAAGFPVMNISGYQQLGTEPSTEWHIVPFTFADSATLVRGRHVMKFGGEFNWYPTLLSQVDPSSWGNFAFDGALTGFGYSDFLLGLPHVSVRATPLLHRHISSTRWGLFAQDTFKISKNLTLDYGLRWELFLPASVQDGLMYNWDPKTANVVVPRDSLSSVSPLYPSNINVVPGQVLFNSDKTLFAPRVGVAYRFAPNWVARGGFGVFNEDLGTETGIGGLDTPYLLNLSGPFALGETFVNQITGGQPLFQFPTPFPSGPGVVSQPSVRGYPLDLHHGHYYQWNTTIERQIRNTGIRASYLATRGVGLHYYQDINKPQPSLIPFDNSRRPYPQFFSGSYLKDNGSTSYYAFQLEGQHKYSHGLQLDAFWTWQRSFSTMLNKENPYAPLQRNPTWEPHHKVVVNAVWEIPVGRGRSYGSSMSAIGDHILGGWSLSWMTIWQTSAYFSPSFDGADPSNTDTFGGLPDRIANGNLPKGQRTTTRWFDPSAFTVPAPGHFGNSGVDVLEGPGVVVHHLGIIKQLKLTERVRGEFSLNVSNIFNHPNYSYPNGDISAPGSVARVFGLWGFYQGGLENADYRRIMPRLRIEW